MSIEKYVRATQLVEQPKTRPERSATVKPGARLATGGTAVVRPKGFVPFNFSEFPVVGGELVGETPQEPVEESVFPGSEDFLDSVGGSGGQPPSDLSGGVDAVGGFVGGAPVGGHGSTVNIGGGAGSGRGDGVSGVLYVCGQQVRCEFGLGSVSPGPVAPPRVVPGVPRIEQIGAGVRSTLALTSNRALLVAGVGTTTGGNILRPASTEVIGSESPSKYVNSSRVQSLGEITSIRRLSCPVSVAPGASFNAVGLRLFLRSVSRDGSIAVLLSDTSGNEVASGISRFFASQFQSGAGTVDVSLTESISAGTYTLTVDTFGSYVEIGAISAGTDISALSPSGENVPADDLAGLRFAFRTIRAGSAQQSVPAFGKNLGVSVESSDIVNFVESAPDFRFSSRSAFLVSEIGSALGGSSVPYAAGVTPFGNSTTFQLALNPPGLRLLDGSPDGAVLVLQNGRVFGAGASTSGRLGFSGASSTLRESMAPSFVDRAAISRHNAVLRDTSGRLYGSGRALQEINSSDTSIGVLRFNAIPQLGVSDLTLADASQYSFQLMRSANTAIDAWDVGGDDQIGFVLASDSGGLFISGLIANDDLSQNISSRGFFKISSMPFVWIRCGYRHAVMITENGDLYGLGDNSKSQFGIEPTLGNEYFGLPVFIAGGISRAYAFGDKTFILAA